MGRFSFGNNLVRDTFCIVRGDGERHTGCRTTIGAAVPLCVNTDQLPAGVHKGATRVAVVNLGVALDHGDVRGFLIICGHHAGGTGDHPNRHTVTVVIGGTESDHLVTGNKFG